MNQSVNGHDRNGVDLTNTLKRIDQKTQDLQMDFSSQRVFLERIALSTEAVAKAFETDRTALTKIVVSEKRVPFALVLAIVVIGGCYILADKVQSGDLNVKIPFLGISITHSEVLQGGK